MRVHISQCFCILALDMLIGMVPVGLAAATPPRRPPETNDHASTSASTSTPQWHEHPDAKDLNDDQKGFLNAFHSDPIGQTWRKHPPPEEHRAVTSNMLNRVYAFAEQHAGGPQNKDQVGKYFSALYATRPHARATSWVNRLNFRLRRNRAIDAGYVPKSAKPRYTADSAAAAALLEEETRRRLRASNGDAKAARSQLRMDWHMGRVHPSLRPHYSALYQRVHRKVSRTASPSQDTSLRDLGVAYGDHAHLVPYEQHLLREANNDFGQARDSAKQRADAAKDAQEQSRYQRIAQKFDRNLRKMRYANRIMSMPPDATLNDARIVREMLARRESGARENTDKTNHKDASLAQRYHFAGADADVARSHLTRDLKHAKKNGLVERERYLADLSNRMSEFRGGANLLKTYRAANLHHLQGIAIRSKLASIPGPSTGLAVQPSPAAGSSAPSLGSRITHSIAPLDLNVPSRAADKGKAPMHIDLEEPARGLHVASSPSTSTSSYSPSAHGRGTVMPFDLNLPPPSSPSSG